MVRKVIFNEEQKRRVNIKKETNCEDLLDSELTEESKEENEVEEFESNEIKNSTNEISDVGKTKEEYH